MHTVIEALRQGVRRMAKAPGVALLAIGTLALGIGGTTATFSVVEGVLAAPLPYREPEGLVVVWNRLASRGFPQLGFSDRQFAFVRESLRDGGVPGFAAMAAYTTAGANLRPNGAAGGGSGEAERIDVTQATFELTRVLGVEPALGRGFAPADEVPGAPPVALLEHGAWQRLFGGRSEAVGSSIEVDGREVTVVGVMPAGFRFPPAGQALWTPLALDPEGRAGDARLRVVARLAPEATLAQADAGADAAALAYATAGGETPAEARQAGWGGYAVPLRDSVVGDVRPLLVVVFGAVGFVLLIACVNVANLMLVQAVAREGEIALRSALGASRRRIMGQLLAEALLLAFAGGALGLGLASWFLDAIAALGLRLLAVPVTTGLDGRAVAFALIAALATGVLFGLAPAFHAARADHVAGLKRGGRGASGDRRRIQGALVVAEIALALVLLVGAGLLVRTFVALAAVDPGVRIEGVLTMQLEVPQASRSPEQIREFFRRAVERIGALPGVEAAGAVSDLPLSEAVHSGWGRVAVERPEVEFSGGDAGEPFATTYADRFAATPGVFPALGLRLVAGRLLDESDRAGAPAVAVVDEAFARRFWPNESPLGRRIATGPPGALNWRTIVGVVGRVQPSLRGSTREQVYFAADQWTLPAMHLVVHHQGPSEALLPAVRREIAALDPAQPVFDVRTMAERRDLALLSTRFGLALLAVFAGLALALAAVGVYGTVATAVARRHQEMGIRQALGARPDQLFTLVLRQGASLAAAGLVFGTAGAAWLTRVLRSQLFGVAATDVPTYAAVAALLFTVVLLACWIPARRAMGVGPVTVLRG